MKNISMILLVLTAGCTSNPYEGVYVVDKDALRKSVKENMGANTNAFAETLMETMIGKADMYIVVEGDSIFYSGSIGKSRGDFFSAETLKTDKGLSFKNKSGTSQTLVDSDTSYYLSTDDQKIFFKKLTDQKLLTQYKSKFHTERQANMERIAKLKRLENLIEIVMLEKGDFELSYDEYLTFKLQVINNSDREISAFKGMITITDLLDNELKSISWTNDDGLKANETIEKDVQLEYNKYDNGAATIKDKSLDKLKFKWVTTQVLFSDGEKVEAE